MLEQVYLTRFVKICISNMFLKVKERPDVGVYVKDLSSYVVNNADDMDRTMTTGNKNRKFVQAIFLRGRVT